MQFHIEADVFSLFLIILFTCAMAAAVFLLALLILEKRENKTRIGIIEGMKQHEARAIQELNAAHSQLQQMSHALLGANNRIAQCDNHIARCDSYIHNLKAELDMLKNNGDDLPGDEWKNNHGRN